MQLANSAQCLNITPLFILSACFTAALVLSPVIAMVSLASMKESL